MKKTSLNHVYRLIWNAILQQWIVVSEVTKGKSKAQKTAVLPSALLLASAVFSGTSLAEPTGGVVTGGSGTISQTGAVTTINQSSQTLSLNWNTFNVARHETVNFVQPSSTALAINQILDTNGSRIMGNINANGQVWLINPNGVFFGKGSQVNVGSLLASTLNPLSQQGDDTQVFGKGGKGSVINKGNIKVANGGYIALIANKVSNQGSLIAPKGTVALAGGSQVTLSFVDNELYQIKVDQSTLNNLAENKQLIQANGGSVFMSAGAKQSLLASVVNNEGIIEAQSIEDKAGKIILLAGMAAGTTNVSGTLDASAQTGDGGFVETSAARVQIAENTKVTTLAPNGNTGMWLIDPTNFNIVSGTGTLTTSSIGATTLSNNLATTDVQIQTASVGTEAGDINVNASVSWTSNNDLTLNAHGNININQNITATGATAKLNLLYGQAASASGNTATYNVNAKVNLQAGSNFTTKLGSDGTIRQYTVITSLGTQGSNTGSDLQGINGGLNGMYVLGADINASATSGWNSAAGFNPLGSLSTNFNGIFDGLGHAIQNLTIQRIANNYVGLFGVTSSSTLIQNVSLVNANVLGNDGVGGLVGLNFGKIAGGSVTGLVQGFFTVGGLAGHNAGLIQNSNFTGEVKAIDTVGGLVGANGYDNDGTITTGTIVDSNTSSINTMLPFSDGSYVDSPNKGGLVGTNTFFEPPETLREGTITRSSWRPLSNNSVAPQVVTNTLSNIQQNPTNPQTPSSSSIPLIDSSSGEPGEGFSNNETSDDDLYDVIQTYGCSA